jgi:hypothetical protein
MRKCIQHGDASDWHAAVAEGSRMHTSRRLGASHGRASEGINGRRWN